MILTEADKAELASYRPVNYDQEEHDYRESQREFKLSDGSKERLEALLAKKEKLSLQKKLPKEKPLNKIKK